MKNSDNYKWEKAKLLALSIFLASVFSKGGKTGSLDGWLSWGYAKCVTLHIAVRLLTLVLLFKF